MEILGVRVDNFEKKEIDFLTLKRTKMAVEDFNSIKLIGKGAFGIVRKKQQKKKRNENENDINILCIWD